MATIALNIAGNAIAPGVGGIVGGLVGNLIDQTLLFPAIFGTDGQDFTGPRLDSLQVQTSSEGQPIKFCFGPENNLAGNLIYLSDLIEAKSKVDGPGKGGGGGKKQTVYRYFVHVAIGWCEGPIDAIDKIWADGKLVYDRNLPEQDNRYDSITHYDGTQTTPNSTIQADPNIDSGDVPAFNGTAYTLIERFALKDFGNRVANFTALIVKDGELSVATAIANIFTEIAGRSSTEVDASRVDGCLRGYTVNGPTEVSRILEPLMVTYNLAVQEVGGVAVFYQRGDHDLIAVDPTDLGAFEAGTTRPPRPVRYERKSDTDLPSSLVVDYIDPTTDYETGSQSETTLATGIAPANNVSEVSLPIVIAPEDARGIARRLLWSAYSERTAIQLTLPPKYIRVLEGDVLTFTNAGVSESVRVQRVSSGYNRLIEIAGIVQDDGTFTQSGVADQGNSQDQTVQTPPPLDWYVFNVAPLQNSQKGLLGVYYAASVLLPGRDFIGGEFLEYPAPTGNFESIGGITEATIGRAQGILAEGPFGVWDRVSTVSVRLNNSNDTLSSKTALEVLNGANRAMIGKELIGFQTATLTAPRTYTLSNLLRGLRGTEHAADEHYHGEWFVLLDNTSIGFIERDVADTGVSRYTRAVSVGVDPDTVGSRAYTFNNDIQRPFPPAIASAIRYEVTPAQTIELKWRDRDRQPFRGLGPEPPTLDETSNFEVWIWDQGDSEWDLLTTTSSLAYSVIETQWTTRGMSVDDPVYFKLIRKGDYLDSRPIYLRVEDPTEWYSVLNTMTGDPDHLMLSYTNFSATTE